MGVTATLPELSEWILLSPYKEIRSLIFFELPELARAVHESKGFVIPSWERTKCQKTKEI